MSAAAATGVTGAFLQCRRTLAISHHSQKCDNQPFETEASPATSVIVYCQDTPQCLDNLLSQLQSQQGFNNSEIIIVNDGSSESIKDLFNLRSATSDNLYLTFIPDEAHNLSRRKLAITLGVKAARSPYVLILDATTSLPDDRWFQAMTRHFADGYELVLGYATYDVADDVNTGRRSRSFDTAADAATYLAPAIHGRPYRGHAANIGFSRKLFFDNKGFSRSLNLHNGEDDIFVSEIADSGNTAVELSPSSIATIVGDSPRAIHRRWKWSHIFTGRMVTSRGRARAGFESSLLWVASLSAVASVAVADFAAMPVIAATMAVVGLIIWVWLSWAWTKGLRALKARKLKLTLPWFILTRPFYNLYYRTVERRHRAESFTWAKARRG